MTYFKDWLDSYRACRSLKIYHWERQAGREPYSRREAFILSRPVRLSTLHKEQPFPERTSVLTRTGRNT